MEVQGLLCHVRALCQFLDQRTEAAFSRTKQLVVSSSLLHSAINFVQLDMPIRHAHLAACCTGDSGAGVQWPCAAGGQDWQHMSFCIVLKKFGGEHTELAFELLMLDKPCLPKHASLPRGMQDH